MSTDFTPIERRVLDLLLTGTHPVLRLLQTQYSVCTVADRKMTGFGFYTELSLPRDTQRIPNAPSFKLGDVVASMDGLRNGAGFLLYIEHGAITLLEGYSYDEPWPDVIHGFTCSYVTGAERDWLALASLIQRECASEKGKEDKEKEGKEKKEKRTHPD
jgi:hypothetical protein